MVFKVSKGGVRTGNTLRGLHSARTKRYGRHACLLGCTSLGRRDFTKLIHDSSEDNELVKETLGKTDVLLSLNKQQRWRLPAVISHMIKSGEFNKGATVSMLEKHKLKRRANCVSLVSNNSRISQVTPKSKKYFSYKLDSIAEERSNREKRRERVKALRKIKAPKPKPSGSGVIHAFTSDGSSPAAMPIIKSEKPEYRLEVFYPCPQSCSLTYNPKYTDVIVAEGKTGELEVKSNVKAEKKSQTTHRKRFNARDLAYYDENVDDVVEAMWDEEIIENDVQEESEYQMLPSKHFSMENAVDMLLTQAKKTRNICFKRKHNHRKNSNDKFDFADCEKSHIVYINDEKVPETATPEKLPEVIPNKEVYSNLSFFKVILSNNETNPNELRNRFGLSYVEASCSPRRFVIDITDDISNLIDTSKSSTKDADFSSYLVFIHDGFYDTGLESYRIAFNSLVQCDLSSLASTIPFSQSSISEIVNIVASYLLENDNLSLSSNRYKTEYKNNSTFLNSRIKMTVDVFDPSASASKLEMLDESATYNHDEWTIISDDLIEETFCDVCYANTSPSRIDSSNSTKLQECGHLVCDECWATHFRTRIREGSTELACAGYDCDIKVGIVTLVTILPANEVATLLQRKTEQELEAMDNAKWCPVENCGRVIKVDSKYNDLCVDVICACGNQLCFNCLGPAHWPAKCDQAEEYRDKLPTIKPAKEYVEEEEKKINQPPTPAKPKSTTMKVEGRLCPRCNKFIEKNGGCPHMMCKCGFQICWTCMKAWHYSSCKMDHEHLRKHTKVLIVKHATTKKLDQIDAPEEKAPKIQSNKQKASLYQRALQQRDEVKQTLQTKGQPGKDLINKMSKEAQKDGQFRNEVVNTISPKDSKHADKIPDAVNVTPLLRNFIHEMITMKKELHQVTEYTFILLQGTPNSLTKQRILKLANDLTGVCSFIRSILDLQDKQDMQSAFKRLVSLQEWAKRALDALIAATQHLRLE